MNGERLQALQFVYRCVAKKEHASEMDANASFATQPFLGFEASAEQKQLFSYICRRSAECKDKSLYARIEKFDLELPISNRLWLSDQLVEPLLGHCTVSLLVNVNAVSRARQLSIEAHAKAHRRSSHYRSHDQVQIAGVKTGYDPTVGSVQHRALLLYHPIPRKGPMIEP